MRLTLILLGSILVQPAAGQRPGCGFGLGLDALQRAEHGLTEGLRAPDLLVARAAGHRAIADLADAEARFFSCGCSAALAATRDAAGAAAPAESAASVRDLRRALDRAAFSVTDARRSLARDGCR